MIKRILVVLSGTPYTRAAIQHAIDMAQRHNARVTGAAILDREAAARSGPVPIGGASFRAEQVQRELKTVQERIDAAVAEFEEEAESADVEHRVLRDEGDPIQTLCDAWRYEDLTLVGLRGLFDYGVFAEPKDALIRLITSGLRPILAVSNEYRPVRRVLVAYSGSLESAKTMKRFVQMRLWPEATLRLLHYREADTPTHEYESLLAQAAEYCMDWGDKLETDSVVGTPKDRLLEDAAAQEADLIVMGDSAKSLFTRHVFGDTALPIIRTADRPLFLSH
jgi:nucleotide-binding universal stress UspA family protein